MTVRNAPRSTANIARPLLMAGVLLMSACGADLDAGNENRPGGRQVGTAVDVTLREFEIDMPARVTAGVVTFVVTNEGDRGHSFRIVGAGLEEELDRHLQPGETRELSVSLKFGTYDAYCPVADHRARGMHSRLQVLPGPPPAPGGGLPTQIGAERHA